MLRNLTVRICGKKWELVLLLIVLSSIVRYSCCMAEKPPDPVFLGSVTVTLHIYSGLKNPTWKLTPEQIKEMSEIVGSLPVHKSEKPWEMPSHVGYRGFSLEVSPKKGETHEYYVFDNVLELGRKSGRRMDSSHRLEKWLLESAADTLKKSVKTVVENELDNLKKRQSRTDSEKESSERKLRTEPE